MVKSKEKVETLQNNKGIIRARGYITLHALMKELIEKGRLDITVQVASAESDNVYFVLEATKLELQKFAQKFGFKLVENGESLFLISKGE